MASGCLGLITFPRLPGRVTLEQIEELYPALIPALRDHPGIGFVARALRARRGAGDRAPTGVDYLDEDGSRARTRWRPSARTPPTTCGAPTASRTAPTSSSTAPTGRDRGGGRLRGARRLARRHGRRRSRFPFVLAPGRAGSGPRSRSSAPRRCTADARAGSPRSARAPTRTEGRARGGADRGTGEAPAPAPLGIPRPASASMEAHPSSVGAPDCFLHRLQRSLEPGPDREGPRTLADEDLESVDRPRAATLCGCDQRGIRRPVGEVDHDCV